jgi:hypothetical protein
MSRRHAIAAETARPLPMLANERNFRLLPLAAALELWVRRQRPPRQALIQIERGASRAAFSKGETAGAPLPRHSRD